jgi:hypothetical protein
LSNKARENDFDYIVENEDQDLLLKILENEPDVNFNSYIEILLSKYEKYLYGIGENIFKKIDESIEVMKQNFSLIYSSLNHLRENSGNIKLSKLNIFEKEFCAQLILVHESDIVRKKKYFISLKPFLLELCSISNCLYVQELISQGDIKLAILKSLIEEFVYSIILERHECYPFIKYLFEFLKKNFEINLLKDFPQYRHIQIQDRISYINHQTNTVSDGTNNYEEIITLFYKAL